MSQEVAEQERIGLEPGYLLAGRFKIERMLAEGGMGRVYIAVQEPIGRRVAIKVMKTELVSDQASVKRFFREAVAVSKLSHPNTITIIDYGEDEGRNLYIAMEYLEGEPLSSILEREGPMPLARLINIVGQVARSLTEAHKKGVIHRDLKPENIFISSVEGGEDFVKVLDFGIAKLQQHEGTKITRLGYVCGTPEYMSPEQARGEELDGRTDLYALGVVMWELLTGRVPYVAPTPLGIVLKHQSDPVPEIDSDAPDEIKAFVYRAMSKDRSERPADAESFLDEMLTAAPDDLLDWSVSTGTSQRRTVIPRTPPGPIHQTGDIASAATVDAFTSSPAIGARTGRKSRALGPIIALVLGLLFVVAGGVGVAAYMMKDGATATPTTEETETGSDSVAPAPEPPVLVLEGSPNEAGVYRGDEMVGLTPARIEGEPGEELTLEIRKDGFATQTLTQTMPEEGPLKVMYDLREETEAGPATVKLVTEPAGATVRRGDETIGTTPYDFEVSPETEAFEVSVELDSYQPQTAKIDPAAGNQTLTMALVAEAKKTTNKRDRRKRNVTRPEKDKKTPAETAAKKDPPKTDKSSDKKAPPKDEKKKTKYKLVH